MDISIILSLQDLLRLLGPDDNTLVDDASVLSCGCLISERRFIELKSEVCPKCGKNAVRMLKPVPALRLLHHIVERLQQSVEFDVSGLGGVTQPNILQKSSTKKLDTNSASPKKLIKQTDIDLVNLFCNFARDETNRNTNFSATLEIPKDSTRDSQLPLNAHVFSSEHKQKEKPVINSATRVSQALGDQEEHNFSRCFPFYRHVSTFATQQRKNPFNPTIITKGADRFIGSAIHTKYDPKLKTERTLFTLIYQRRWELYSYVSGKPSLLVCGKLTGEFGSSFNTCDQPKDDGLIIVNDFFGGNPRNPDLAERKSITHRLKSWSQLRCCLSDKYLVILGTKGIMRVLNTDPEWGRLGQPVYTYIIDFLIRCIAIAPNNKLIACGVTTKEKVTSKQQPFVILHQVELKGENPTSDTGSSLARVTPITIAVPYRDPLKIITFNASSTHLLCCTVYEMRYFIIRLREEHYHDYTRPRLIFSDTNLAENKKSEKFVDLDDSVDLDLLLTKEEDDQMLDSEGITDIKFGQPFTNTIIVTSSSLKDKPSVVLKVSGPSFDSIEHRKVVAGGGCEEEGLPGPESSEEDEAGAVKTTNVLMRIKDIGSNIYGAAISPRGDCIIFVDKLGRLLLVVTKSGYTSEQMRTQKATTVVLLGEVSPALRYTEAASVCFSSDGGKVMTVDRKGVFRVFDFTKGVPGENPDVVKCKIISVL